MDEEAAEHRFREGAVIAGKYALTHTLGQGGMGLVVAAIQLQLDRRVAIKFLLPRHLEKPDVVSRFTREARSAAKIQSDHVAHVLDVGVDDGTPYMVMEYLEGEDLKDVLKRRGPLPVEEAVRHVMHACEALAEAHALGIVHRDLKPANLFLAKRPNGKTILKVLDFGISKIMNPATETELTMSTSAVGSPSYMSPEQLAASKSLDGRADIWALGVVLYELLARRRPFVGDSMPSIVAQIMKGTFEKLDDVCPELPLPVVHAVHRCLEHDPAHRFATVTELAAALAPFAPAESVSSLDSVVARPAARASMAPAEESIPGHNTGVVSAMSAAARPDAARGRLVATAGTVAAFMLLAGGVLVSRIVAGHSAPPTAVSALAPPAPEAPAPAPSLAPLPSAAATTAAVPSTSGPPATAPSPLAPAPSVAPRAAAPRPARASAGATSPAAASAAAAVPACHAVSYFDALGDKHFKQECQ